MYIYVIFDPNQVRKPQGNKVVQYFKILNSVRGMPVMRTYALILDYPKSANNQGCLH